MHVTGRKPRPACAGSHEPLTAYSTLGEAQGSSKLQKVHPFGHGTGGAIECSSPGPGSVPGSQCATGEPNSCLCFRDQACGTNPRGEIIWCNQKIWFAAAGRATPYRFPITIGNGACPCIMTARSSSS